VIGPIESEVDSSVNSGPSRVERGVERDNEFGDRNQTEGIDKQRRSASTDLPLRRPPVGPFAQHRERAELGVSEAQRLNPSDPSNLQNDEPLSAQGMKRVNNFNGSQGLVG
jgi:hypothetical protein